MPVVFSSRTIILLALTLGLLLLPAPVRAEDEVDPVEVACRGVVAGPLHDFRDGDGEARARAEADLLAQAHVALPIVLAAAESTADASYRARCLALAPSLGAKVGTRARGNPGAELPSWERGAIFTVERFADHERRTQDELLDIDAQLDDAEDDDACAQAMTRALRYARAHPDRLLDVLRTVTNHRIDHGLTSDVAIRTLEAFSRKTATTKPRREQGLIALTLVRLHRRDREKRFAEVARAYADVPAGLLAEYERIRAASERAAEAVERLLVFADAHPGTPAARMALQEIAFHLASSNLTQKVRDAEARFERLATVAALLQRPEFAGTEAPLKAADLLAGFFFTAGDLPQASAQRMLAAYRSFFRHHFVLDDLAGSGLGMDFTLPHKMKSLHEALGVPEAGLEEAVEKELATLEAALPDKAGIRYLRAERRVRAGDLEGAHEAFRAIEAAYPDSLYARKALLARAGLTQAAGDLEAAEALYATYVAKHPTSPCAWLASLRVGHSRAQGGDMHGAIGFYQQALSGAAAEHPPLGILARIALARAYETTGEIRLAVDAYRDALAAWPASLTDTLSTEPEEGVSGSPRKGDESDKPIRRADLELRIEVLDQPSADPADVARLMQGEQLSKRGDPDAALGIWGSLVAERPDSPVAEQARERIAMIWIERAIKAANRATGTPDLERVREAVAKIETSGGRSGSLAAALVDAALLLRTSEEDAAFARLEQAFRAFAASQRYGTPKDDFEKDIAEIFVAAFAPKADAYGFDEASDQARLPYVAVSALVEVTRADGTTTAAKLAAAHPDVPNLLYLSAMDQYLFYMVFIGMGALPEATSYEEAQKTPGSGSDIARLLGRLIPVKSGHWGGWLIGAFPMIHAIRLEGDGKATVPYRIGYEGGDAKLTRRGGRWTLVTTTNNWIE